MTGGRRTHVFVQNHLVGVVANLLDDGVRQKVRYVVAVVVQNGGNAEETRHSTGEEWQGGHVSLDGHIDELSKSHWDRERDHGGCEKGRDRFCLVAMDLCTSYKQRSVSLVKGEEAFSITLGP